MKNLIQELIKKVKALYAPVGYEEEPQSTVTQIRYMSPSGRIVRALISSDGRRIR